MFLLCCWIYVHIGLLSFMCFRKIDIQLGRKYLDKSCSPGGQWSHFSEKDKQILLDALKKIETSKTFCGHLLFWPIRVPFLIVRYYMLKD